MFNIDLGVVRCAEKYSQFVVGFISQSRLTTSNQFYYCTPGQLIDQQWKINSWFVFLFRSSFEQVRWSIGTAIRHSWTGNRWTRRWYFDRWPRDSRFKRSNWNLWKISTGRISILWRISWKIVVVDSMDFVFHVSIRNKFSIENLENHLQ